MGARIWASIPVYQNENHIVCRGVQSPPGKTVPPKEPILT